MNLDKYINKIKNKHIRTIIIGAKHMCIMTLLAFVCLCLFMFCILLGVLITNGLPYILDKLMNSDILLRILSVITIFILTSYVVGKCVEFFNKDC